MKRLGIGRPRPDRSSASAGESEGEVSAQAEAIDEDAKSVINSWLRRRDETAKRGRGRPRKNPRKRTLRQIIAGEPNPRVTPDWPVEFESNIDPVFDWT